MLVAISLSPLCCGVASADARSSRAASSGRVRGEVPAQAESFAAMRSATMIAVTFVATDGMSGRIPAGEELFGIGRIAPTAKRPRQCELEVEQTVFAAD